MAYLGYSDDFDLDDDGILRDSMSSGGILIDDDGIIRDSFDTQSKYTTGSTGTHWTDSGLERDKHCAGSTSTLRHSDLQSYQSFDDISHPLDDHANISDLEASKDDLSLDQDFIEDYSRGDLKGIHDDSRNTPTKAFGNQSGRSSRSSFSNSLNFEDTDDRRSGTSEKDLFDPEYYKQLQELGVLLDNADFSQEKNSLNEFEELEAHVSRDNLDFTNEEEDEQGDEIEEFLRRTPTREQLIGNVIGQRYDDSHDDIGSRTRPSTANSARTIGSEPFPEISPEEALQLFKDQVQYQGQLNLVDNDAASIEFQESQQTPGDDDEIFIITSRISDEPGLKKRKSNHDSSQGDDRSISPRSITSKSSSRLSNGSRSNTPLQHGQGENSYKGHRSFRPEDETQSFGSRTQSPFDRSGSLTPVSATFHTDSRPSTHQGSRSVTPNNRPNSAASQRSLASDSASTKPKSKSKNTSSNLSKAKSQESFFETENQGDIKTSAEKMPKRLLPKPTVTELNQPLKVKSKSTTNISSSKPKPLKPKYGSMSMSLVNIDIGEGDHSEISTTSEKSRTELSSKLYQEFHKRKQATELVQQLQQDYDKLLSKYAQAELTIDQLRLGATVHLHTVSPTPNQALQGVLPAGQQPQTIQMGQLARGVKSPSPFQGSLGVASPLLLNESTAADQFPERSTGHNDSRYSGRRSASETSLVNGHSGPQHAEVRNVSVGGAEGVRMGLVSQAHTLDERMDCFQNLLGLEEGLTHEEQEKVFDQIRSDHEKLRKDYLQAKEDYNARKRSSASGGNGVNFDDKKELEGELFKLGMKFDEIHEKVEEKRKERHSQRQPFATNRIQSDSDAMTSGMSDQETRSVDQMKKKMRETKAGNDLLEPKQDHQFQKNLKRLHDTYNALMDRYRRLKQMAQTPERDQEIDNLVRKLHGIVEEEPDIFRMPQELTGRWEELQRGEEDGRSFSRRQSEASVRRQSKDAGPQYAATENKQITRGDDTPDNMGSNSSSLHRSDLELNGGGQGHNSSMYGSRSSLSSRQDTTFDRDSPTPRLPRPRRHDHPDRRAGNLKKRPEGNSMSSLQDSGISDQEGATGHDRSAKGPLSNLPGPGTFKQMTKQRHAGDADSGFIGSMVGSEVSQGNLSARQQQPSLRLRQPSDSGSERPRSSRHDDTHSVTSSRSGRRTESGRLKKRQDRGDQTRDYTDDSYTLTTESEMSFDIPERPGSRRNRNLGSQRGSFDRAIQEEEEERPRSILSNSSRGSRRSQPVTKTPIKAGKAKPNVSFSSKSDLSEDEDVTPKPTPNQSFNESREIFTSSDEGTPRESQQPVTERLIQQQPATVSMQEEMTRPPTPGAKKEAPRSVTPKMPRAATPIKKQEVQRSETERPRSREERPRSRESRSVGYDSDDTAKESVATAATRGSESSEKFKMLQDEIGHLREEFFKAMQQKQQQNAAQPPPPPQQPQQPGDQYFDPTEDPYAFMRGPRRRANSFSGAGGRDWDEWWKYPLTHQTDDFPLGYAAADSYNLNRPVATEPPETQTRSHRKTRRKYRRNAENDVQQVNDSDSEHAQSRVTASTATDEQLMNYYVPQYYTARTQTSQSAQGYFSPNRPARMQRYSSQPNLLQNSTLTTAPLTQPVQTQNVPTTSYATPISAGYSRIPSTRQPRSRIPRPYSYHNVPDPQPIGYIVTQAPPPPTRNPPAPPAYMERTEACPLCGGDGYHTHGEYVYEVPSETPPVAYLVQDSPRRRPRRRSKSASRIRDYSPHNRIRTRYVMREYVSESSSADSDDDIVYRRRSRSLGRRSRRTTRKYKKSREYEDALNQSLNLTEEIGDLTYKMMGSVKSELAKSRRRKDFGSSYW